MLKWFAKRRTLLECRVFTNSIDARTHFIWTEQALERGNTTKTRLTREIQWLVGVVEIVPSGDSREIQVKMTKQTKNVFFFMAKEELFYCIAVFVPFFKFPNAERFGHGELGKHPRSIQYNLCMICGFRVVGILSA